MEMSPTIVVFSLYVVSTVLILFVVLLIVAVIARRRESRRLAKWSKYAVVLCVIASIAPVFVLMNHDWSIPECRNSDGTLKTENPRCQFP